MKKMFAIDREHRNALLKEGRIELEGVLTPQQCVLLQEEILGCMNKRAQLQRMQFSSTLQQSLVFGRDLWRDSLAIKTLFFKKFLHSLAQQFLEVHPLRIGLDQTFIGNQQKWTKTSFPSQFPLQQILPISGSSIGFMFCITPPSPIECAAFPNTFSLTQGNMIALLPSSVFCYEELMKQQNSLYLLLVYTDKNATYCEAPLDCHTHDWKRLDYRFGGGFSDLHHPLLSH